MRAHHWTFDLRLSTLSIRGENAAIIRSDSAVSPTRARVGDGRRPLSLSRLPHHRTAAHRNDLASRQPARAPGDLPLRTQGAVLLQPIEDSRPSAFPIERSLLVSALLPRPAVAGCPEDRHLSQ